MEKKLLYLIVMFYGCFSIGQSCPTLIYPSNGAADIPVDATLSWPKIDGISTFIISLGTTPNGVDILNRRTSGPIESYTPPVGLPESTEIYVSIILLVTGEPAIICPPQRFTTMDVTTPPNCTTLNLGAENSGNVSSTAEITWNYAPTATGYRIAMGTSSGASDLVDDVNVGNVLSYNPPNELPFNSQIFVRIIPYNENGEASSCLQENFTTGISSEACEPYLDDVTGAMIQSKPDIKIPDQVGICENGGSNIITTTDVADGFRWYRINEDDTETLLSDNQNVNLQEKGRYRYEAYNRILLSGSLIECSATKEFMVVASARASITMVSVTKPLGNRQIEVYANGIGDYEFALDNINGPYQDQNIFTNVPPGQHRVFVRDKNGCGIMKGIAERDVTPDDFPKFFTPNGDNINDFWQFIPPAERGEISIETIHIFDRYGNLLSQIDPSSEGWDGNYMGKPLPSSDYWFKALGTNNVSVLGHFALKR